MEIAKIQISGFKSFATKTEIQFRPGITAIVGPNGSGKSNISDAVRWVLGEQSKNSLRSKKGEDIIFAGSAKRCQVGRAEVSLDLKNLPKDPKTPFPKARLKNFPQITITRRFYRNGEGECLLNRAKIRLKDLREMLAELKISPKTYTIIGQGMIDKVISLSPEEKREIFLDASGAKVLEVRRQEAGRKLEKTENNLERVQELLLEITPHLKRLKRQYNRAQRREKVAARLKSIQKTWYTQKLRKIETQETKLAKQDQDLSRKIQERKNKITNLRKHISQTETERTKSQEKWQILQEKYNQLHKKRNFLQEESALLKGRLEAHLNHPREDLLRQIQKEISDLGRERKLLNQEIKKIQGKRHGLQEEKSELLKKLEATRKRILILQKKTLIPLPEAEILSALEKILKSHDNLLFQFKKAINLKELAQKIKAIRTTLHKLVDRLKTPSETKKQKTQITKLQKLQKQVAKLRAAIHNHQSQAKTQEEKIGFLRYQDKTFQNKIEALEHKLKTAQETKPQEPKIWQNELSKLKKKKRILDLKLTNLSDQTEMIIKTQKENENRVFRLERNLRKIEDKLAVFAEEQYALSLQKNTLKLQKEELFREIKRELGKDWQRFDGLKAPPDEVTAFDVKIERLKHELEMIGAIDPETLCEYETTQKRYDFLENEMSDMSRASETLQSLIHKLDRAIEKRFSQTFSKVNLSFKKYFRTLFGGGKASLNKDREDKISIYASPPGKRLKSISVLSGGEKSLVGLALIFAILSESKPPFCIFDEVDAALDEANSIRFAKILKNLSRKIQLITITHNRETMKKAQALYGVTMGQDGVSKLLSLKLGK